MCMSEEYDVFYYTDRQHTDMDDKYYEYEIRKYDPGEEDGKGQYQMWWRVRRGLVRFDRTLSDESYDYYYRQMDKDDLKTFDDRKIKRQVEKSKRTKILDEGKGTKLCDLLVRLQQL